MKTGKLLGPLRLVWDRTGTRYPEGPHLYKIRGRYYLMIAEGGTEYGHMVTLARSDSPWGPFEPCPRNPILTHRETENDMPVQGTGHADLVEAGRRELVDGLPGVPARSPATFTTSGARPSSRR